MENNKPLSDAYLKDRRGYAACVLREVLKRMDINIYDKWADYEGGEYIEMAENVERYIKDTIQRLEKDEER